MYTGHHRPSPRPRRLRDFFCSSTPAPRRFGSYDVERELGRGGMGIVYLARHRLLGRRAALKVLRSQDTDALRRFAREVRRTAFLRHPSTVTVYDYGQNDEGLFYYAMELVEGPDLATLVHRHGPQDPRRVVGMLRDAAGALAEAHGQGLVHRDVKPANLMIGRELGGERTKVCDFGLVREAQPLDPAASATTSMNGDVVTGTPHYIAPEAIRMPMDVDGRADLYSLGATAYFLLTGRHVFADAGSTLAVCAAHLQEPVVPPSWFAPIPAELEALVLGLLAKDRNERPPNAEALLRALDALPMRPCTGDEIDRWWDAQSEAPSAPVAA